MRNSKRIKEHMFRSSLIDANKAKNKLEKVLIEIYNWTYLEVYCTLESFVNRIIERTSRSWAFAKFAWLNYDFDSNTLYSLMAFKLKRLYSCLKNGIAYQDKKDMDALKEAIKICERLYNEKYEDRYHNLHDKKWGKSNYKIVDGKYNSWRNKARTEKQKEQQRKEYLSIYDKARVDRHTDINRLSQILKDHDRSWWE